MEGLVLLQRAKAAGLDVRREGNQLVVRGPRSAEPLALELLSHKSQVLTLLGREQEKQDTRVPWLLEEWRRVSIPAWQRILAESIEEGDRGREDYARWMLREVLLDPEYPEPPP